MFSGFSADAPEEAVNDLSQQSPEHQPSIENDQSASIVNTQ